MCGPFKALVLTLLCLLGCSPLLTAAEARADEIVLVADPWCPFNCVPESGREGYMVDVARAILEADGHHHLIYRTVNWSRAIRGARDGTWAGIIGALPSEAPDFAFPRIPQGRSLMVLFARAGDSETFRKWEALDGKVVATVKDYDYGSEIRDLWRHASADEQTGADALRQNFLKLWSGRVDLVLAEESVARQLLIDMAREGQGQPVRVVEPPWPPLSLSLYVAFSPARKDAQSLADLMDRGMVRLRANGGLDVILARYGIADWELATASK
ncbi:MAG: transporter substrate-binding domain-containing protein [Rhodospirillum sp.]|nr:transporter substrate-binding domain-containing protein [Rhodospirillum sp.]MCF8488232.1 transporter substrate-binding domain-containing protein [Rhodospirillum sp.]MCF8501240.1 transporter substrate-binding domain-containing protein [Rhodospirillum sp.]